ncbi:MAG: hypothetical protein WBG37_13345 [Desulfobacterales bacterium]
MDANGRGCGFSVRDRSILSNVFADRIVFTPNGCPVFAGTIGMD